MTPVLVRSMLGIGDSIFQRAILRELMKQRDVELISYYGDMYWDLIDGGLSIKMIKDKGRIEDSKNRAAMPVEPGVPPIPPRYPSTMTRLHYDTASILREGSVLAAMFKSAGLRMPALPDYSLPVKDEWKATWRDYLDGRNRGKPILVYRPPVLNSGWTAPARVPDPIAYAKLHAAIPRDRFFVVSVAAVGDKLGKQEWIVGPKADVDLELNNGELNFQMLCALFSDASLVYGNAGFVPVLAQAVGTPVIIVYGGYECFATTHVHGAKLTPTLPIDTEAPCRCFIPNCQRKCSKQIDMASALSRVQGFVEAHAV